MNSAITEAITAAPEDKTISVLRRMRESFVYEGGVGISQQRAADLCNVSRQTWAAWEARTRPINLEQLNDIKQALDLEDGQVLEIVQWAENGSCS